MPRGRRRWIATCLAALLAVAVFWALRERGESAEEPIAAAGMEARGSEAAAPPRAPAAVSSSSAAPARIAPPVFDEIRVEKEEVCEGEENLVTVRAHTTDGNDPFLHYTVAGEAGAQVPVRSFLGRDGKPMPQMAVAFSRGNVATAVELPPWRVKSDQRTARRPESPKGSGLSSTPWMRLKIAVVAPMPKEMMRTASQ